MLYKASAQLPDGNHGGVENGAVDSDGTLAMAFQAISPRSIGKGGGIALFDITGAQVRIIETPGYWPKEVAFGPDHSIWTIGALGTRIADMTADYFILRNYSRDGAELGHYLPRSSFPNMDFNGIVQPVVVSMFGLWELHVADNSVEVIFHHYDLWVQTDLNGFEKGRWNTKINGRPTAITADGRAWRVEGRDLKLFDRPAATWRKVAFEVPNGTLIGAEGNDLVFELRNADMLRRMQAP